MNYIKSTSMALVAGLGLQAVMAGGLDAINDEISGKISLNARLRYESADHQTLQNSHAITARARLGYEYSEYELFSFLIEGEFSAPLDSDTFDAYPAPQRAIIADGETEELNRLQLTIKEGGFTGILGRQRIILNNARFVGNVGWRQNEQTYDAATAVYAFDEQLSLLYSYVDRANRIFGSHAPSGALRSLDSDSHVAQLGYKQSESLSSGLYLVSLDIENVAAASHDTLGAFVTGDFEANGWKHTYRAEYAKQQENSASGPGVDYDLDYLHISLSGKQGPIGLGLGWEVLEGDGVRGFSTPLATLHAFNGWADTFLNTPASGLEDLYGSAEYTFDNGISTKLVYHSFDAENGSNHYGSEIDAVVGYKISDELKLTLKYANYNGTGTAPGGASQDQEKIWFQLDASY